MHTLQYINIAIFCSQLGLSMQAQVVLAGLAGVTVPKYSWGHRKYWNVNNLENINS